MGHIVASLKRAGEFAASKFELAFLSSLVFTAAAGAQTPIISVSPGSMTYAAQKVGTAGYSNFSFEIENNGNQAIAINSIAIGGVNPYDFAIEGSNCGNSLPALSYCLLSVIFEPTALGARSGTLSVSYNGSGSPQTATLSGTGVGPIIALSVNPNSLVFGPQNLNSGSAGTISIQNVGNTNASFTSVALSGLNIGDFSISSNSCGNLLAPQDSCNIGVSFVPSAVGVRSALLTIADNASGSPQTVALSGTGQLATAMLCVSANAISFGARNVNTGNTSFVNLGNAGSLPLSFTSFAITGANAHDFAIDVNTCESPFGVGSSCSISLSFTPSALGTRTATLAIADNASGSPQVIALSGTGQTATTTLTVSPSSLTFAPQNIGTSVASPAVFVTNTGNTPVVFSSIAITGANAADFAIANYDNCVASLPVGQICYEYVNFTPTAIGVRTAALVLTDNASGLTQTIPLSGTGQAAPTLTYNPASVNFGTAKVGAPASQTLSISNSGTQPAVFSGFTVDGADTGDFVVSANACPLGGAGLKGGSSCSLTITFTPSVQGARSANLAVANTTGPSPQVIFLGGNGATATRTLAFQPIVVAFGNQTVGTNSPPGFVQPPVVFATNTGTAAVSFSSIAISGANASDFSLDQNQCAPYEANILTPNASCTVSVLFAPSAAGPRSALLTFTDNAAGATQSVPLTGNGITAGAAATLTALASNFGVQDVGVTGGPRITYILSTGHALLNVSAAAVSGPNAADFTISNNTCLYFSPLPPGQGCEIDVTFTPSSNGLRSATLTVNDNAPSSPETISLTGVGQSASKMLTANAPGIALGPATIGATFSPYESFYFNSSGTGTVTIRSIEISGTNAADFTFASNSCAAYAVLPSGGYCAVQMLFIPSAAGTRNAILTITSDAANSPLVVAISGVGVSANTSLGLSPNTLSFSEPTGMQSAPQTVTLLNTGAQGVTLSTPVITGPADYAISSNDCPGEYPPGSQLNSGQSCTIQVVYTPSATGPSTATLGLITSAGNKAVSLNGLGQNPSTILSVPADAMFALQGIGLTSLPQAIQIKNAGSLPLSLSSFAIKGTNAGDFSIDANSCPASLPALSACTVGVTFTPSAAGARSATLIITDDAVGSPQSVILNGTGESTQRTLTLSTSAIAFGASDLGAATTGSVVLTNGGNSSISISSYSVSGSGDFSIGANTCATVDANVIPPGGHCTVTVRFAPSITSLQTATLQIYDNASGSPQTVQLNGSGQSVIRSISLSAATLDFGGVNAAGSASRTVSLTNTGHSPVTFASFAISGANAGDFTITGNTCGANSDVLGPLATCAISITLKPSAVGVRSASLQIADNASGNTQTISLAGLGQQPAKSIALSQLSYDAGVSTVGVSVQGYPTFYLINTGTASVTFTGYRISGANAGDFSIASNTCSSSDANVLPAGAAGTCALAIAFKPTAAGLRSAVLSFSDDAAGSPQSVTLTGIGQNIAKTVTVSAASYDFGAANVGSAANASFIVFNSGTANITLSSVSISGKNAADFVANYSCGQAGSNVIAPQNSCSIFVTFTPSATGIRTAALAIADDASGSPQNVALTGVGQQVTSALQVSQANLLFSSPVGTLSAKNLYFANNGTGGVSFSNAAISGTNAADFAVSMNNCQSIYSNWNSLPGGSNCNLSLTFTPSVVGSETAVLSVTDSASNSPQKINLIGTGQSLEKVVQLSSDFELFSNSFQGGVGLNAVSTGPVTLTSATINGTNAADFTISGYGNCGIGQVIGDECTISVQFAPLAQGLRTANLQITDDATANTQHVVLQGYSAAPGASLTSAYSGGFSPTPINVTSAQNQFIFENFTPSPLTLNAPTIIGANAADFAIASNTCVSTLGAYSDCFVNVTFTPSAVGPRTAAIQIGYSGGTGTAAAIPLGGDGTGGSGFIALNPLGLEFDGTNVNSTNSSAPNTIVVTNTGTGPVNFGQITFAGKNANDFTVYQNGCGTSLAPDANCEISVQFTPAGSGLRSATMQISGDAPNLPQTVSLIGAGQAASEILYASTLNLDLGSQNINGGTNNATLSLQSNGTAAVSLGALQITGPNAAEFAIANTTCGNILSQTCTISISFSPLGIGPRTANLTIASNVSGSPLTIGLSGVGQPDTFALTLSQVTADFGLVSLNTQTTATISLTNEGSTGVNFGVPAITGPNAGDFVIAANTCVPSAVLPPPVDYQDNSCAITVAFSPSVVGERNATLQVIDNLASSPQTVNLYGTGQVIQRSLSASAVTLDFGGQDIGTAASSLPLQITNTGTGPVNLGAFKITGTNAADFAIDPLTNVTCLTATSPGSTCTVYVFFTPSLNGPETATLTVTSDASTGPILVSLLGEGQKVVTQLNASESKLDLGIQTIGNTSAVGSFNLTNNGDTVVTFYPSSMTGAGAGSFVVTQNTCTATLAPGSVCSMSVAFAPSTTGVAVAALNINSTASPITVWLTGTGIVR